MSEEQKNEVFQTLHGTSVSQFVEKKQGLSYLSWAVAWAMLMEKYPNATYEQLPYEYNPDLGFMVHTRITIEGSTREMWLPVMDDKNKAMKTIPYEYQTKTGKKVVEAATMTDINNSYMRCLVKNIAMFGLGLDVYIGEDIYPTNIPTRIAQCNTTEELLSVYNTLSEYDKKQYKKVLSDRKEEIINNQKK